MNRKIKIINDVNGFHVFLRVTHIMIRRKINASIHEKPSDFIIGNNKKILSIYSTCWKFLKLLCKMKSILIRSNNNLFDFFILIHNRYGDFL